MPTTQSYTGIGIYTIPEVARLTKISAQKIRHWTRPGRGPRASQPAVKSDLSRLEQADHLTFLDLIELRFVEAFRSHGLSLQSIRLAAARARDVLETSHPFATHSFKTDGSTIFAEIADDTRDPHLLDLVRSQYALHEVLASYLYEGLEFDDGTPSRWYPRKIARGVVLDPDRQFGHPIVDRIGVPTAVLAAAHEREGRSVERVAAWYEVEPKDVRAAIRFEQYLEQDSRAA